MSDNTIGNIARKSCLPNVDASDNWVDMVQQTTPSGSQNSIGKLVNVDVCREVAEQNKSNQQELQ